jgi:hypothetical protein
MASSVEFFNKWSQNREHFCVISKWMKSCGHMIAPEMGKQEEPAERLSNKLNKFTR